jgi:hypothetical protein
MGKLIFGLVLLLAGIAHIVPSDSTVEAHPDVLAANAGPDQTVVGPSPVMVQFDGSGSQPSSGCPEIDSYKWYNQWGDLRAEGVAPIFEVNFGHQDSKPGTSRTFTLVVEDCADEPPHHGVSHADEVTITLSEEESQPPPPDDWESHSENISVGYDGNGDHSFSYYEVVYEVHTGDDVEYLTFQGGIIDTERQDYSYVYYTSSHGNATIDCHSNIGNPDDSPMWDFGELAGAGCIGKLDDANSSSYEVTLSTGPYEGGHVWYIDMAGGDNSQAISGDVGSTPQGEPRFVTARVVENQPGYGDVRDAPPGFPGHCDTAIQPANWDLEWYTLNNDLSRGDFLGTSQATGNLSFDWGFGSVFQERDNWLLLIGKATIVVQREGPVLFQISKDDGAKLFLDGSPVMANSRYTVPLSKSIMLAPGIYDLELHYYETVGKASLNFQADQDVLQWTRTGQCYGEFVRPPSTRYFVHEAPGKTLQEVASRFGASVEEVLDLNRSARSELLLPGAQADVNNTKVIVLRGIDSSGSCSENDGTLALRHLMVRTVQNSWPSANGMVSQVDDSDIIAFSYSGRYMDCSTGQQYTAHDFPGVTSTPDIQRSSLLPLTPVPIYSKDDTCLGVKQASQHLEDLVNQMLRLESDARFVIVGHSLGGMVAAYYVSQQPAAFVEEKIQKVVTVDSPLMGFPERNPGSICAWDEQSWQDIFGNGDTVPTIRSLQGEPAVEKFYAINSTDIGDALTETGSMNLDCALVSTAGGVYGGSFLSALVGLAIGGPGGLLTFVLGTGAASSAYGVGHECVLYDETALGTISRLVNVGN